MFLLFIFRPSNTRIKRQVTGNRINVNIDDFADGLTNIDVTRVVPTSSLGKISDKISIFNNNDFLL